MKRWVRLKNTRELVKSGFKISHVSDDGEFISFGKGGSELGIWQGDQPRLVVNHSTIHENAVKQFPDAFVDVEEPEDK